MTYRQQSKADYLFSLTVRDKPTNSKNKQSTDKEGKFETVAM